MLRETSWNVSLIVNCNQKDKDTSGDCVGRDRPWRRLDKCWYRGYAQSNCLINMSENTAIRPSIAYD